MVNAATFRKPRRRPIARLIRLLTQLVIIAVLLPVALLFLYRVLPPVSTPMAWTWATGGSVARDWVPLEQISPSLVRAVVSAEDARYCSHQGVDWEAVRDVMDEGDDSPRGASTIPMQTVKNLFLWQSRSYVRKGLEVPLAYAADFILGKRRLMEIYLNIAEWGPGVFGAEAAAERHFDRKAAELSDYQAALLAASLPNPRLRDPGRPGGGLANLASIIADRAAGAGRETACLAPIPGSSR